MSNLKWRSSKFLPVVLFLGFAAMVWLGLSKDPRLLPPVNIGRAVPEFALQSLSGLNLPGITTADLKQGKITLVNIWASWCIPCREEQPLLLALSKRGDVQVVGINNKDDQEKARDFLGLMGNPFSKIGVDSNGRATIDFGSYGVPESFLVDGNGIIRFKIIGGLTAQSLNIDLPREIAKAAQPFN